MRRNDILERWRSAGAGRSVERDRYGATVLREALRFTVRQAFYDSLEAAADAVIGGTINWEEPKAMYGTRHR